MNPAPLEIAPLPAPRPPAGAVLAAPRPARPPVRHFRRTPPPDDPDTRVDQALERAVADTGTPLRCAGCRRRITTPDCAMEIQGGHEHVFTNPHGYRFLIACFGEAPGCRGTGEWTGEHTWFAGCRWRYALCGACGLHLGWEYGGAANFFGLIKNRLVS